MDNLFRKAAANYPLDTGNSRWEEIAGALAKKDGSNRRRLMFLFLFLITGLITAGLLIFKYPANKDLADLTNEAITSEPINNNHTTGFQHQQDIEAGISIPGEKKIYPDILLQPSEKERTSSSSIHKYDIIQKGDNDIREREKKGEKAKEVFPQLVDYLTMPRSLASESNAGTVAKLEVNIVMTPESKTTENKKLPPRLFNKGFYYGLAAGPAFSEVKRQGIRKTGFDLGVLAGYRLNDRISIETGILFSKKFYHSSGKYFDMSKMPAGMDVLSLEGSSNILEIPLKFNYRFISKGNAGFYGSAGFSSYILTREKNDYKLLISGSPQDMLSTYKEAHGYPGVTLNLSAGYSRAFGKKSAISIEPYIKLPLRGIGVGSMQVMSTGLQIAITKRAQ